MRLVLEHRQDYPSEWAAITSIAAKCGMTTETLRQWVRRSEVNEGERAGLTTDEREAGCYSLATPSLAGTEQTGSP